MQVCKWHLKVISETFNETFCFTYPQAQPVGTVEPGKKITLPFTVATNGSWESFNIKVNNDRDFRTDFNSTLTVESGGSVNGTVTLTVPENTTSGTDVTLTIQAEVPDGSDSNYAVLRLAVIAPVIIYIL